MKKILQRSAVIRSLIAAVFIALFIFPATAQEYPIIDFEVDGIPYHISSPTAVSIVRDENILPRDRYKGDIVIPATVENNGNVYKVTEIGRDSFGMAEELTGITIGENVVTIGLAAFFNCRGLTDLTIPANVRTIEWGAFLACDGLQEIIIEEGVRNLFGGCFSGCGFRTVTIPASVKTAENGILSACPNLTSISVAEGNTIFKTDDDGVLYDITGKTLWQYPAGKRQREYVISSEVNTLYESCFEGAENLNKITIPASITSIQDAAFFAAYNLKNIICEITTPLVLPTEGVFSNSAYQKAILRVPDESVNAYKNSNVWKNFKEIMGFSDIDITQLKIDPSSLTIRRGDTYQLEVIISPENSTYKNVVWSSDDEEVVVVSQTGEVLAVDPGTALICCETPSGNVRTSCFVTVLDEFGGVERINTSAVNVTRTNGGIIISGDECNVKIYSVSGNPVYTGSTGFVSLPSGVYLVNVGTRIIKIVL